MLKKLNKYKLINIDFISAKKNTKVKAVLNQIILKQDLLSTQISKSNLNKFIIFLNKQSKFPKIKNIAIKPKYIVQIKNSIPKFKIFINSKNKTPKIFERFFENAFREYFELEGVPIIFDYISSKNPFIN